MFASSTSWYTTPEIRFFFNDPRQEGTGTFYSYWTSRKKPNRWGRTWRHIFLKNPGVIKNISFKKTLEFLGLLLHPWKLLTKESFSQKPRKALHPLEIPHFSWSPLIFYIHEIFLQYPWKVHAFNLQHFFLEYTIPPCLDCYISRFCEIFYKAFF